MTNYLKRKDETFKEYYIRLYQEKDLLGLTFKDIGLLLNEVSGNDYNEAKWRRPYEGFVQFKEMFGEGVISHSEQEILEEIKEEKLELQKEKYRMRDQKREFSAIIRRQARLEHLSDYLEEALEELEPAHMPVTLQNTSNNEGMVVLSDWHLGAVYKGRFNNFDLDIAKQRIGKVKQKTLEKVKYEGLDKLHIANLGDMVHGLIHVSTKIQSEEDVIQQIITASDLLTDFIKEFADMGIQIEYYNVIGNHGRVVPNKNEVAGVEENFEKLILKYLELSFNKYDNVNMTGCQDGLIETEIVGKKFILTHGNFDRQANSAYRLPQLLGYVPDYIISGHTHHDFQKDFGRTMVIVNPSLIGADDYAASGRYGGRAGQKFIVFNENDIDSITTIQL